MKERLKRLNASNLGQQSSSMPLVKSILYSNLDGNSTVRYKLENEDIHTHPTYIFLAASSDVL